MKVKLLHEVQGLKTLALVFESGEEVNPRLLEFARESSITSAAITGIGGFREVTLAYFDMTSKQYKPIAIAEQVELVALNGNVSLYQAEPRLHLHAVIGKADGSAWAGHLLGAVVRPTLELVLVQTPAHLQRRLDPLTGLPLLDLSAS